MEYSGSNVLHGTDSMGLGGDSRYTLPSVGAGNMEAKTEERPPEEEGEFEPGPSGNKRNSELLIKRPRSRSIERRLRVIEIQLMCLTKQVEKVLQEVRNFQSRHSRRRGYSVSCPKASKRSKTERLKNVAAGEQSTDRQGTVEVAAQIQQGDMLQRSAERSCNRETDLQRSHFVEQECPCLTSERQENIAQGP